MEQTVHDGGAARIGQQFAEIADQATRWSVEDKAQTIAAGRAHFDHIRLALGHFLHNDARIFLINVDDDFFNRLKQGIGFRIARIDDLWTRNGQLEALAAHLLDQNSQLQFAAACDFERILVG